LLIKKRMYRLATMTRTVEILEKAFDDAEVSIAIGAIMIAWHRQFINL